MEYSKEFTHAGLNCLVTFLDFGDRVAGITGRRGHFCGYVEVPDGHALHGVGYSNGLGWDKDRAQKWLDGRESGKRGVFTVFLFDGENITPEVLFDVHGSLTFSGARLGRGFWYGFDCGHYDDSPEIQDAEYTENECRRLAEQIAAYVGLEEGGE